MGILLLALASIATLVGWIWLIVIAFKQQHTLWAWLFLASFLVPIGPIVAILYLARNWGIARQAGMLLIVGFVLSLPGTMLLMSSARSMAEESAQALAAEAAARQASAAQASGQVATTAPTAPPKEEPAAPRPPAPPAPAPAPRAKAAGQSVKPGEPAPRPPAPPASPASDPLLCPVQTQLMSLGEPAPNQLRTLRIRVANNSDKAVRELKLDLAYYDTHALRIGGWTTIHSGSGLLTPAKATNEFEMTAFFVPQFTTHVQIEVQSVVYADSSRWPENP